jgi:hypothetical protein
MAAAGVGLRAQPVPPARPRHEAGSRRLAEIPRPRSSDAAVLYLKDRCAGARFGLATEV